MPGEAAVSMHRLPKGMMLLVQVGSRTLIASVVEDQGPVLPDGRHVIRLRALLEDELASEFDLSLHPSSIRTPPVREALRAWIKMESHHDAPRWLDCEAFARNLAVEFGDVVDALHSLAAAQEIVIEDADERRRLVRPW